MPKLGGYKDLDSLRGPRRELARMTRDLCRLIGGGSLGLRDLSIKCNMSRATLSRMVNGKANANSLKDLHRRAEEEADGIALPLSLDLLIQLHEDVLADEETQGLCARCPAAKAHTAALAAALSAGSAPAAVSKRRPPTDTILPVPFQTGDRRGTIAREWLGIGDLSTRLVAGEVADAAGILRHVGLVVAAPETAAAITACRREGLDDEAGAMIVYAARRTGRDVMQIAKALLDNDQPVVARELLELTLAL